MGNINRVTISGNLTRDGELRSTANGTTVLGFGVAVNDRRRNPQTGEWEDVPNFVDCTMFGNRAEGIAPYITKGTKVAIEGKLRWSQWERDGQKRSKLEVIVDEIELMTRQNAPQGQVQPQPTPSQRQAQAPAYGQQAAPQPYPQPYQPAPAQPAQQYPAAAPSQGIDMYAPPGSAAAQPAQQGVYDEEIPF